MFCRKKRVFPCLGLSDLYMGLELTTLIHGLNGPAGTCNHLRLFVHQETLVVLVYPPCKLLVS